MRRKPRNNRRKPRFFRPASYRTSEDLFATALDFFGLQQTLRLERYLDGLTDPVRREAGIGIWNQSLILAQIFILGFIIFAAMILMIPQPEKPRPLVKENPLDLLIFESDGDKTYRCEFMIVSNSERPQHSLPEMTEIQLVNDNGAESIGIDIPVPDPKRKNSPMPTRPTLKFRVVDLSDEFHEIVNDDSWFALCQKLNLRQCSVKVKKSFSICALAREWKRQENLKKAMAYRVRRPLPENNPAGMQFPRGLVIRPRSITPYGSPQSKIRVLNPQSFSTQLGRPVIPRPIRPRFNLSQLSMPVAVPKNVVRARTLSVRPAYHPVENNLHLNTSFMFQALSSGQQPQMPPPPIPLLQSTPEPRQLILLPKPKNVQNGGLKRRNEMRILLKDCFRGFRVYDYRKIQLGFASVRYYPGREVTPDGKFVNSVYVNYTGICKSGKRYPSSVSVSCVDSHWMSRPLARPVRKHMTLNPLYFYPKIVYKVRDDLRQTMRVPVAPPPPPPSPQPVIFMPHGLSTLLPPPPPPVPTLRPPLMRWYMPPERPVLSVVRKPASESMASGGSNGLSVKPVAAQLQCSSAFQPDDTNVDPLNADPDVIQLD